MNDVSTKDTGMFRTPSTLRGTAAAAAILSLCAGASAEQFAMPGAPPEAAAAVYELMFTDNASAQQGNAAAFCIGVGTGAELIDPDPAVLLSIGDVSNVEPASACAVEGKGSGVVLQADGRNALLFGVEQTECTSETECQFRGSYYEGNLSSQTNIYVARNVDGVWRAELVEVGPLSSTAAPVEDSTTDTDKAK